MSNITELVSPERAALTAKLDEKLRELEESRQRVLRLAREILATLEKPRA